MQGRLLLDVVIREGAAVLELFAREYQALLVGRDALPVLDLGLDVLDPWLDLEDECFFLFSWLDRLVPGRDVTRGDRINDVGLSVG